MEAFTFETIVKCRAVIGKFIHQTPVVTSKYFNDVTGREIFFKCENFQKTGSFKARGAVYSVHCLKNLSPTCTGVITHSSGNHGAALAYAAQTLGVPCTVVCPKNAPAVKIDAIRSYGAEIILCEPTMASRQITCENVIKETGRELIHPHDNYNVMTGQGTLALELFEQVADIDAIIVPVGGGGMFSGIAEVAKHLHPNIRVFAVQPLGKKLEDSLNAGKPLWPDPPKTLNTVADGLRVQKLGSRCFPVALRHCERQVFTVEDSNVIEGMRLVFERLKLVVEPSSGTGVAAILSEEFQDLPKKIKRIAVILCGGNVDLQRLPWIAP